MRNRRRPDSRSKELAVADHDATAAEQKETVDSRSSMESAMAPPDESASQQNQREGITAADAKQNKKRRHYRPKMKDNK